jgi:hypothetical protein
MSSLKKNTISNGSRNNTRKSKKNNNNKTSKTIVKIITVNVGIYLLGGVNITKNDFAKLPVDIRNHINSLNLPGVSDEFSMIRPLDNPNPTEEYYYYNSILSSIIQELLCKKILNKIKEKNPDIICTQEDVLVRNNESKFTPIFHSIYEKNGYKIASVCESHLSFSPILKAKYGTPNKDETDGNVKLGNVIYVKKEFEYKNIDSIEDLDTQEVKCSAKPRCASGIEVKGKKIYNVHLCGGRYDDKNVFANDSKSIGLKISETNKLIKNNADIILGDFNSTIIPEGYDYKYPISLLQKNEQNKEFNRVKQEKWSAWQQGPITNLIVKGYETTYSNEDTTNLNDIEPTTNRGNTTVDWIFYKPDEPDEPDKKTIKCIGNEVVHMYKTPTTAMKDAFDLTDHHAIMATFEFY